jgi:methionyl-tRNA formyltransferase
MKRPRILFMGSGEIAGPALRRLAEGDGGELVGVVTQPDRPRGRSPKPAPCPVMTLARSLGLNPLAPERVSAPDAIAALADLRPDVIVVAAYGQFLPPALLALSPKGAINLHPSLLPRYRGAAPVQWAIANGERETGVSIIYLTERMDAGDILLAESVFIGEDDTAVTLSARLADLGARLLVRALDLIAVGAVARRPQDERLATYAPKLKKEDGRIDWERPAVDIRNRIRGFQPWPGAFFHWPRKNMAVRVQAAEIEQGVGLPGTVLAADRAGPLVACGREALRLRVLQPEGRRPMEGAAFCAGYRPEPGERFSAPPRVSSSPGTDRR